MLTWLEYVPYGTAFLYYLRRGPTWMIVVAVFFFVAALIGSIFNRQREALQMLLVHLFWLAAGASCGWIVTPAALGHVTVQNERWSELRGQYAERRTGKMNWRQVKRTDFGDAWPLTVDNASVGCSEEIKASTVIIVINNEPWALNGTTKGAASGGRLTVMVKGVETIVKTSNQPEWWWALGEDSPRKNIRPMLDVAEQMGCLTWTSKRGR